MKRSLKGNMSNCLNCDSLPWSHTHFICIPAVHIISFSVSLLLRVDNSINWPASSTWVFIAQLGEHCSANAEATGSNPVETPKNVFFGLFSPMLKLRFTAMVTYSFHIYFCAQSSIVVRAEHIQFVLCTETG